MDTFDAPNPFMKGDATLHYVGSTSFGQKRQLAVPLVVNEYKDGKFETLFVARSRLILPTRVRRQPDPAAEECPRHGTDRRQRALPRRLLRADRAGPHPHLRADERAELRPRADVRARRLRHLHRLCPARPALRRRPPRLRGDAGRHRRALRALPLRPGHPPLPARQSRPCCSPPASPSSSTR